MLEIKGIFRPEGRPELLPGALVGQNVDVLLGRDPPMPATLGADVEGSLELLPDVDVAAIVALLPRIGGDLPSFASRGTRLTFLLEPGHYHPVGTWCAGAREGLPASP
jgi:hypothetical protein